MQSHAHDLSEVELVRNESGLFSSESVLHILKLILDGSELPELLTIIAELVESQGNGALCTIWLPDADGKHLHCAAAPSLPGFASNVGRMCVCPKGASCGTAVYRREPVYVADILRESIWDDYRHLVAPYVFAPFGRAPCSPAEVRCSRRLPSFIVSCLILTRAIC